MEGPRLAPGRWILWGLLLWWTARLGAGIADWCFLDFVNLAFHEAGHLLFSFAGETVHSLGGTLGQLLVPALLCGFFLVRERRPFAAAFCLWWLGESLVNVSVYMADARDLALPLVGGGDHDWNGLFYRFGLLGEGSVRGVSAGTRGLGTALMLAGLAWSGFFLLPAGTRERLREGALRNAARRSRLREGRRRGAYPGGCAPPS